MTTSVSRRAAVTAASGFAGIAALQTALACGAPLGKAAWGGAHTELPAGLRFGSAVSAVALTFAALLVLRRAGFGDPSAPSRAVRWGTAALVPLLATSALGNFASMSKWEQFLMGPLALVMALLCLVVVRGSAAPLS